MATYVNDLRLKEIGTGESSGTWGSETNTNLELIGEALGFGTEAITTNADTHTTTVADGSTDPGRAMYLKYTGTLDSACTITIAPNTMSRMHFIENGTSGSQNIIISQGTGANVTIPAGDVKAVYLDGAGSGAAVVDAFASLNVVDLKVEDDLTVTDDLIVNGDIDLEGNMDVNGSLETDALSLNGTTVTSTAAEINLLDGSSANTVVNSKAVIYGSSGEVAGTLSTAAQPNITSVGTLTALTVDDITINGSTISDAGDIAIDVEGDIILDANGGDISLKDNGTHFGNLTQGSNTAFVIKSVTGDSDIFFQGVDGSTAINALQLDMSDAGSAYFNNKVGIGTTSPSTQLHVQDTGVSGLTLERNVSGAGASTTLQPIIFGGPDSASANANHSYAKIDAVTTTITNGSEDGNLRFFTSDSGSLDEAMRIDSAGRLLIGETSNDDGAAVQIDANSAGATVYSLRIENSNTATDVYNGIRLIQGASGSAVGVMATGGSSTSNVSYRNVFHVGTQNATSLVLGTNDTERMRINSSGLLLLGATSGLDGYASSKLQVSQSAVDYTAGFANTRSTGSENFGVRIQYPNATANGTGNHFLYCDDATAKRFAVRSNGGIENFQGNNVNLSDERVKKNIVDTPDTLEIIKNLKVRDFQYKDQTDNKTHTGLIAQETEKVDASLVDQNGWSDEAPEGEEPYKAIYNTDLMFKMLKAIQEQQEQIEQLKVEIQTLKGE
jgi:hypothetical protein